MCERTRGYHKTLELRLFRCVFQTPAAGAGGGRGGIGTICLTGDTLLNELLRDPLAMELTTELFRDAAALPGELLRGTSSSEVPRELFREVAALYCSGESGLSSSKVPIDLRQRSVGVTLGRCEVFHASRTVAGDWGRRKSSAE